jgi:uncharacterized protein CbrC (UPF0167 family)
MSAATPIPSFPYHPDPQGTGVVVMLRHEPAEYGWPAADVEDFLDGLDKDGDHTAYLFACRHCGTHLAYSDSA